jgi:GNAT superfamily N-acetyltransferase
MTLMMAVRDAALHEIPLLEALQLRASVVAPDYRDALAAHPEVIHLPATDVSEGRTRVAMVEQRIAGFSVVLAVHGTSQELDGLFVEPDLMGKGVGRALIDDVVTRARPLGARTVDVIANPTAVGFYRKVGFTRGEDVMTQFGPAFGMHLEVHPTRDESRSDHSVPDTQAHDNRARPARLLPVQSAMIVGQRSASERPPGRRTR